MQLVSYHSMSHTLWKTLLYTWEENESLKDKQLLDFTGPNWGHSKDAQTWWPKTI